MDSIAKIDCILTKKGISGSKMASDIGLSNSIYSQWNSRKVKPSPKSLIKIANYLDVEVDEILADTEESTTPSSEAEKEQKNTPPAVRQGAEYAKHLIDTLNEKQLADAIKALIEVSSSNS